MATNRELKATVPQSQLIRLTILNKFILNLVFEM